MDKEAILYSGTQSTEDLQAEETDPEIMETDTFEFNVTATVPNPTVKTNETKKYQDSLKKKIEKIRENHGFTCMEHLANCGSDDCISEQVVTSVDGRFPSWCVQVRCVGCRRVWNLCKFCCPVGKQKNRLTSISARRNHDTIHLALAEKERKRKIEEISNPTNDTEQEKKNINDVKQKNIHESGITDFYNWKQFFENRPTHSEYLCHHNCGLGKNI